MNVIKELLNSKKFIAALVGVATSVAIQLGIPEVRIDEMITIISPILAYIGAQGFADMGKSAAHVEKKS